MAVKTHLAALFGALVASNAVAQSMESDTMAAGSIMWPPTREWSEDASTEAPCGSTSGPRERTEFPLSNGRLALVTQDDTSAVHISVSYSNDPQDWDDFESLETPTSIGSLDLGHTCIPIDSPSSSQASAGDNATFSMFWLDADDGEMHYACADVTFVELSAFDESIPCFNATVSEPEVQVDEDVDVTTTGEDGEAPHDASDFQESSSGSSSSSSSDDDTSSSSSSGISDGAIAGAVVGSVAGLALIATAVFFLFRRSKSQKVQREMAQRDAERDPKRVDDSASERS
ncbi:hypothetical protein MBLNU230_g0826t1 [Neophaeotheca triangularis]